MIYIIHVCKGTKEFVSSGRVNKDGKYILTERCNNAWVDADLYKSMRPPSWKYCPACEAAGYVSPDGKTIDTERSERCRAMNLEVNKLGGSQ